MARIFASDVIKLGGALLSGSGAALFYNGGQLAQGTNSVSQSQQLIAGSGLEGGGAYGAGNITLNIGSGSGIVVGDNNINIDLGGIVTSMLAGGAVTNAKVADGAGISVNKLQFSGFTLLGGSGIEIDSQTVNLGSTAGLNLSIDKSTIVFSSDKIAVGTITNNNITDASITPSKLSSSGINVYGRSGLRQDWTEVFLGGSVTLDVATDETTIEVNSDALRVKPLGLTNAHISNSAGISVNKLASSGLGFTYSNGLTGSLTTNLGQTNNLTLNLDPNTLSVGGNNTLRVLKTTGTLSQQSLHGGIDTFAFDGSSSITVAVDGTVVRTSGVQVIAGNKTFSNNVTIGGDLNVVGTTTSVNSNEVNIGDSRIVLNSTVTTSTATDGGLVVHTGISGNAPEIIWSQANREWQLRGSVSGAYYGIHSEKTSRAGSTNLLINESSKVVYFNHAFLATPIVTASIKAPNSADLIGIQVDDVTTTGVGFIFTTNIPTNSTHTLNWMAQEPT